VSKGKAGRKSKPFGRDRIVAVLRKRQKELRGRFGVKSLALFGSAARDNARKGRDIDLLVEFDRPVGFFMFCEVQDFLSDALGGAEVDLVLRHAVIDDLKDIIYGGAVDVIG
jgi:predicted nucleotidyltransferase